MKRSRFLVGLGLAVLVVVGASTAEAQLARQGSYSGSFGAQGVGTLHELDAGHIFFVGGFNGVFMNEESGGFLDRTQVICPGINDIVEGLSQGLQGYCIATDEDGDKAFAKWAGIDDTPNVGGGEFEWIGGTGKYEGITGSNTFHYAGIGATLAYSVTWEGEWNLP
jgi:hypothetical protein